MVEGMEGEAEEVEEVAGGRVRITRRRPKAESGGIGFCLDERLV